MNTEPPDPAETPQAVVADVDQLRRFLTERDLPCPSCSYNLRGLTSSTCPECNHALVLRVGLADPHFAEYLTTIVALAVGAGAAFLFLTAIVIISMREGLPGDEYTILLFFFPLGMTLLLGLPLAWLVRRRGRRRFGAVPKTTRRWIAIGAWVLTLGLFGTWLAALMGVMR